jgi:hypothetical protein
MIERIVAPINTRLIAATVQAVIKIDITLRTADRRTGSVPYQPRRGECQASGQDCEHKNPSN